MGAFGNPLWGSNRILAPGTHQWVPRNVDQRRYPPNQFNACLDKQADLWRAITCKGNLMAVCPGRKYADPPWIKMPANAKTFREIKSISLTNVPADGSDVLVGSFLVPLGYDGSIVWPIANYTGTGFQEGSGDLSFRFKLNLHYVKDLGNLQYQMGSLKTFSPVNSGQILLKSGQLVQLIVSQSVNSTLSGGRVILAALGYYWPR